MPESPAAVKSANSPATAKRAGNPAAPRRATVVAAGQLPPGLPRTHYKYRTTVAPAAPLYVRRGRAVVVEEEVDVLFSPLKRALRAAHQWYAAAAGLGDAARLLRHDPFLQL